MNKRIVFLLAIALCFQINYTYAQKRTAYIASDSSIMVGVKLAVNSPQINSQYITVKGKDGKDIKYTPDQITGYGFKDGTKYISEKIRVDGEERKVFLEQLVHGMIILYRYVDRKHKIYFVRKGPSSGLQEIGRDMETLRSLSEDCEFISEAIKLVTYNKESLQKFVAYYNDCEQKPFPYRKVGILAGMKRLTLKQPSGFSYPRVNEVSIPSSSSPMIGVFADLPIFMSDFSVHPELFFARNTFTANVSDSQSDLDILISLSTVQAPILIRYTIPALKWKPFFNIGPYFSYNVENSSDVFYATIDNSTVIIDRPIQAKLMSDFMFGYSAGMGLQRKLNFRKTITAEVRFTSAAGPDNTSLIQSGLDVIIGFTF